VTVTHMIHTNREWNRIESSRVEYTDIMIFVYLQIILFLFFFSFLFFFLLIPHLTLLPLTFLFSSTDEQLQEMTSPANYNRYKEISRPNVNKIVKLGMAFRGTYDLRETVLTQCVLYSFLFFVFISVFSCFFIFMILSHLFLISSFPSLSLPPAHSPHALSPSPPPPSFSPLPDIAEKEGCVVTPAEIKEQLDVLIVQVRTCCRVFSHFITPILALSY
jgi:hypothetical protein